MATDPVERTPEYLKIKDELEAILGEIIKNDLDIGLCHWYWAAKKRILKEKYNIDWKSPPELNPDALYD